MATQTPAGSPEQNIALVLNKEDRTLSIKPIPLALSPGHHLIKVTGTALTAGELFWPEPLSLPITVPGFDVAGTIVNEVPGSPFRPGDRVYAGNVPYRPGAARQFTEALPSEMAAPPANLSWDEIASMPLSALTAWQALFTHAGLTPPDQSSTGDLPADADAGAGADVGAGAGARRPARVLVTAASGGVGVWTVQLAKLAGAYVVATCGTGNIDMVRRLGADEVLDYRKTDIAAWVAEDRQAREFDIVIDCVGKKVLEECWTVVREGGFLNSVAEPADPKRPTEGVAPNVRSLWFIYSPVGEQLKSVTKLIEDGKCRPVLDSAFDFEDYEKAFARVNGGHVTGKVVLRAPRV